MPTAREIYLTEIATNPRFRLAPKRGEGTVIIGAEPGRGKTMSVSQTSFQDGAAPDDGELT